MEYKKMIFANNNFMNMVTMQNPSDMLGSFYCGSSYDGYSNGNIFGYGFDYGYGYNNCQNIDYDAMAGAQVGQSLVGIAVAAIGSLVESNKTNSLDQLMERANNLIAELDVLDKEIDTHEKNALSYAKIAEKYIGFAQNNLDLADSYMTAVKNDKKILSDCATNKAALEAKLNNATTEEEKVTIKEQIAKIEAEYKAAQERISDNNAKAIEAYKVYQETVAQAEEYSNKVSAEQEAFNTCKQKMTNIMNELNPLVEKINEKAINKGDGNILNRISTEEYNSKFDENGNLKADAEVNKATLRKALYNYRKASPEERVSIKKQIIALWENLPDKKKTGSLELAYTAVVSKN